jgi:hypothetical protein
MPQVVGLRCPHCAAALPAEVGASSVKCAYCGTTSLLRGGTIAAGVASRPASSGSSALLGCGLAAGVLLLVGMGTLFFLFRSSPAPTSSVVQRPAVSVTPALPVPRVPDPVAAEKPPVRTIERIDTGRRPLLVDVNADGHPDIVARTDFSEGPRRWTAYAAHDSQTGAVLWTVDLADGDRTTHAAAAHGRLLLLTAAGQVTGHDLKTGASQWSTALGERGQQMCASTSADAIEIPTLDKRVLQLDVKTGRQAPVAAIPECAPLPTDFEPNQRDPADRTDPRAPAGTVAIRCGGVSMYTSSGFSKLPDQCRQRSKVAVDDLAGLVAHSLWQTDAGWLVLGVRKPGTYVPTIGLVDKQRRLAWKADVPDGNPLLADEGGPDPAVLLADRVVVGFNVKGQPPRLASFALADGARQWTVDVPGGKRVQRATAADDHLFLYSDGAVHLLNPADGKLVRTLGKTN